MRERLAWLGLSEMRIILITSVLFALIHWSSGIQPVSVAFVWGVLAMVSLFRTGSLWPALTGHFIVDFLFFSEIVQE